VEIHAPPINNSEELSVEVN